MLNFLKVFQRIIHSFELTDCDLNYIIPAFICTLLICFKNNFYPTNFYRYLCQINKNQSTPIFFILFLAVIY